MYLPLYRSRVDLISDNQGGAAISRPFLVRGDFFIYKNSRQQRGAGNE